MPECVRCGDFTDNTPEGEYHYCNNCLDKFTEIEASGVIVEQGEDDGYHVIVTASDATIDGGTENSQVDALARGKYIAQEQSLDGIFTYKTTGSKWILDEYLKEHPDIRQDVHERLRRIPEQSSDGLLDRLRGLL